MKRKNGSKSLSDAIFADYKKLKNWRKVGEKWGLNPGTAYDIGVYGYEPKGAKLRSRLGLPALIPTAPCPIHGVVHKRKTCPTERKYRDLFDMPVSLLRWKLKHRDIV